MFRATLIYILLGDLFHLLFEGKQASPHRVEINAGILVLNERRALSSLTHFKEETKLGHSLSLKVLKKFHLCTFLPGKSLTLSSLNVLSLSLNRS